MKLSFPTLVIFLGGLVGSRGQQLLDLVSLYSDLFTDYDNELLPVYDLKKTTFVNLSSSIQSINQFDELTGQLDLTMLFTLTWIEDRMTWNPDHYNGITNVLVTVSDVWHPQLEVVESITYIQELGSASHKARLVNLGEIVWTIANVLQVVCSVDVTFFPFDTQTCTISLSSKPYITSEVRLLVTSSMVDTFYLTDNSMWELENTTVLIHNRAAHSACDIVLKLKRRSEFYVIYIIIPLLILGILNSSVFIMPSSSGERHSVAVTMFLAFMLYMNVINSTVPQSSSPLAYLYYYILFLIMHSSMTMFLCIVSMCLYDCKEPVPDKIQTVILTLRCRTCRPIIRRGNVEPEKGKCHTDVVEPPEENIYDEKNVALRNDKKIVTWAHVGKTFDAVCLLGLLLFFVIYTVMSFKNIYQNKAFW